MFSFLPFEIVLQILEFFSDIVDIYNFSLTSKLCFNVQQCLLKIPTLQSSLIRFCQENHRRDNHLILIYYGINNQSIFLRSTLSYRINSSYVLCYYDETLLIFRTWDFTFLVYDAFEDINDQNVKKQYDYLKYHNHDKDYLELGMKGFCDLKSHFYHVITISSSLYVYHFVPFSFKKLLIIKCESSLSVLSIFQQTHSFVIYLINDEKMIYNVFVDFQSNWTSDKVLGQVSKVDQSDIEYHQTEDFHFLDENNVILYKNLKFFKHPINKKDFKQPKKISVKIQE